MVKRHNDATADLRQAQHNKKVAQAKAKKLLANAKLDIKEYRKELSTLKKAGLVSKRIHAGRHKPTRYMLGKIKTFKTVATGQDLILPASKLSTHRLREYIQHGLADIVTYNKKQYIKRPKTSTKQKISVDKGHIKVTTEIGRGEYDFIVIPKRLNDMHDVLEWLEENEDLLMERKGVRPQFGFQLQGHNSRIGLDDVQSLIKYLMQYNGHDPRVRGNIFNGDSEEIRQEFVLFYFRPSRKTMRPEVPEQFPKKTSKKFAELRGREKEASMKWRKQRQSERRNKYLLNETAKEKEERLRKQRERDRARANIRREKRMANKLLGD